MKIKLPAAILVLSAAVLGCGNHPPELTQVYSQVNFVKAPEKDFVSCEFTVLVSVDDEDGEEDVDSVYIINDDRQLYWSVERGRWNERNNRGMKWYGSQRLSEPDGSPPLPGEYRVLVNDRAGEQAENNVFIPFFKDLPKPEDFPKIVFNDNKTLLIIESPESRNVISFYDDKGKLLGAFTATQGAVNIGSLGGNSNIADKYSSVNISFYSNRYGAGLISGPWIR